MGRTPTSLDEVVTGSYRREMRAVGIKTLKNRLSEYVRLAAAGETVLVTDRDRVVAELRPPSSGRAETAEDAQLAELVRQGWLRPPLATDDEPPPRAPSMSWQEIDTALTGDREER